MQNWCKYKPEQFEFNGKWISNWFSNMIECLIIVDGIQYNSVENYYQAMKTLDVQQQLLIAKLSPHASKSYSRKIKLRDDWDSVKIGFMKRALIIKFTQNPYWRQKLIDHNDVIIEWNNWGDKYWGVTINDCLGNNVLGVLLMQIRSSLIDETLS